MLLLAIDTSAGTSVALVDGERVVAEAAETDTRRHAEAIDGLLVDVLEGGRRAGVDPARIAAVVAGMGPGPFTGLRVGIAAARAFALGRGIPVHPLGSHDAVAADRRDPVLVVTDARRREVAWSAYDGLDPDGLPALVAGPALASPAALAEAVASAAAGDADRFARLDPDGIPAAALARLAARRLAAGRGFDALAPLYLRAPDVTPSAGPKRVTA